MVPIENSVEGGVSATLDNLATGDPLVVVGRCSPITFVLAARRGDARGRHGGGHPQSRVGAGARLVGANLPGATYVPTCRRRRRRWGWPPGEQNYQAAVCAPIAADQAGLTVPPRTSATCARP